MVTGTVGSLPTIINKKMKLKLLFLSTALLLSATCFADIYPQFMPGKTDNERVKNAFEVGLRTHEDVRLSAVTLDSPIVVTPATGENYTEGLKIVGDGVFSSVRYSGTGAFLTIDAAKRVEIQRVGFLKVGATTDGTDVALRFTAKESASSIKVVGCTFQGFGTGLAFDATGGADISVTKVEDCTFTLNGTGLRFSGSNNLDPRILNCNFSSCNTAIDLTKGGSNVRTWAIGGSYCKVFIFINGGYQGIFDVTSFEGSGTETFLKVGGDLAGGSGQPTSLRVTASDVRTVKTLAELQKSGYTELDIQKADPRSSILLVNKSSTPAKLVLSPSASKIKPLVAEGVWNIIQN